MQIIDIKSEHDGWLEPATALPFDAFRMNWPDAWPKLGFVITGVMPDANGFGKPDIFMVKRVGKKS